MNLYQSGGLRARFRRESFAGEKAEGEYVARGSGHGL